MSPYGVYDMTGNVDEWVVNESGEKRQALRERPQGRLLGPGARSLPPDDDRPQPVAPVYQIGFRCCADVR